MGRGQHFYFVTIQRRLLRLCCLTLPSPKERVLKGPKSKSFSFGEGFRMRRNCQVEPLSKRHLITIAFSILLAACSNEPKSTAVPPTIVPPRQGVMQPFRYHKLIEVSPGQDYDIVSWGRGSSTIGAFAIFHSDSAAAKYTTTTGDLDGAIVDVFNTDMDLDGNPEILIQAKGNDTINYSHVYAFEFTNGRAEKLEFPRLNLKQRQGYRGDDNFYVQDGKLVREFPIYTGSGKETRPSGQKRQLEYGLRDNSFTVKQLSKGSTNAASNVAPVVIEKPKNTSSSKHHTVAKKKKKKHRRRSSEDDG